MYNLLVTKPLNIYHQKYFVISFRGSFYTFQIFHVKVLEKLDFKTLTVFKIEPKRPCEFECSILCQRILIQSIKV